MASGLQWPMSLFSEYLTARSMAVANSVRGGVKSLTRALGYDIRRIDSYIQKRPIDFIRSRNIDVVVDVGANIGQYGQHLRHTGYKGWIVSAEPVSAVYDVLAARAAADVRWNALNLAFGEKEGAAQINVSEWSVFSSIRPQLPSAAASCPQSRGDPRG